ncbi:MAG TPA: GntR family transcriptional regulator [Solirubrobacterales bacterium]|nr:GntR family transcriptional regulator [Solirubrobacterales bacterium]
MPKTYMENSYDGALPPTRASAVAAELRQQILDGAIAPGTRLRQAQIAERYGVSTTPVREAFVTLAREGLVRQDAHRGAIVFAPSIEELAEIYEIRATLEAAATRIAARKIDAETLAALDDLVARMRSEPPREYPRLNNELHTKIYLAADRPRLFEIIENLRRSAGSYLMIAMGKYSDEYLEEIHREHEEIIVALRDGTPSQAAAKIQAHLRNSSRQVQRIIRSINA